MDTALPDDVMTESCGDPPGDRVFVEGEPGYRLTRGDTADGHRGNGPDFSKIIHDDGHPTSRCFQDSGIPLPGDPGYKGCCVQVDGRWGLDPTKRMTRDEERTRYARQGM